MGQYEKNLTGAICLLAQHSFHLIELIKHALFTYGYKKRRKTAIFPSSLAATVYSKAN